MRLCVDVGNTTIGLGIYQNNTLMYSFSLGSDKDKTDDEYYSLLNHYFPKEYLDSVSQIIYSSVVPSLDLAFKTALSRITKNADFLVIGPGVKNGLLIRVDSPKEIGADLIADLVGGKEKYSYPTIIVDLGTASKILLLDKSGAFSTCVIMPGLYVSKNVLTEKAALLSDISLEKPLPILECKNTKEAMTAGLIYGHIDMINGIVSRYESSLGYSCKKILTGGASIILKEYFNDFIYDASLCLDGLNIIANKQK